MRKIDFLGCLLSVVAALGQVTLAQETKPVEAPKISEPPAHFYLLTFVVQELNADGKPENARTFSTAVSTDKSIPSSSVHSGDRVPIVTGTNGSGGKDVQYSYVDVGVGINILSAIREIGHNVGFYTKLEVTSLAGTGGQSVSNDPVIRQHSWGSEVLVPIGKPTVVFASDALESKGSMQVVLTATPIQ